LSGMWEHPQASPHGPSWSRRRAGAGAIEHRRGLAQSLIERNHSMLKGVQVKSIPTRRGGRAGGAEWRPCPSVRSAGSEQAAAVGIAARSSAAERQAETCRPLLRAGQTQQQHRVKVGSGSPWRGGGRGAVGPQDPAFHFPLIRDECAFSCIHSQPAASSWAHELPPQN